MTSWVTIIKVPLFKDLTRGPRKYATISDVDEDQIFLDVREYIRKSLIKNGVSLFLPEAHWLKLVLKNTLKLDCVYYFEAEDRKVILTNTQTGLRILTVSPKTQKSIELSTEEREVLIDSIEELCSSFDKYFKEVGGVLKYEFNAYKQSASVLGDVNYDVSSQTSTFTDNNKYSFMN